METRTRKVVYHIKLLKTVSADIKIEIIKIKTNFVSAEMYFFFSMAQNSSNPAAINSFQSYTGKIHFTNEFCENIMHYLPNCFVDHK